MFKINKRSFEKINFLSYKNIGHQKKKKTETYKSRNHTKHLNLFRPPYTNTRYYLITEMNNARKK